MAHEARQQRLLARMAEDGLDAMLVTDLTNVRYLTGYVGTNGVALIAPERRLLFTDSRYVVGAREQTRGVEVVQAGRDLLDRVAAGLRDAAPSGRAGFEADQVTVSRHRRLTEATNGVELVATQGVVEGLRVRKDPGEIALMREAARIADAALATVLDEAPLAGRREGDVAWRLEGEMRAGGAEGTSFPPMVLGGPRSARPHAVPDETPIDRGTLVVVDLGARFEGYCSDCTRTFATGPLPEELERIYALCRQAQSAALAAVRPGIAARDLDAVARDMISAAGYGDAFGHGLGHGVGLDIHERPWVRVEGTETLEAGMVVTVEPGIYLEGLGGVRIEDLVLVTEDGGEPLGGLARELQTR
jgi:Xaa-Pro aminopeptidase